MKKISILVCAVLTMASCTTVTKSSKTADLPASIYSATVADLEIMPNRVTYKMERVPKDIQRGGYTNVQKAVVNECLEKVGNGADILVEPDYVITVKRSLFSKKIKSIEVSGRPAKYKNFRSLNDSVWCNPTFRSSQTNSINTSSSFLKNMFGKKSK